MTVFQKKLLEEALRLRREYGLSVIPIRNDGNQKKGAVKWSKGPFGQKRPATEMELRSAFKQSGITGLGIVLGPVSGGLVCRDFDTVDGYKKWARKYPKIAKRLPTAKTSRGYHVYFIGPAGWEEFDVNSKLGEGEYRGTERQIALLPPSKHPNGCRYKWRTPLGAEIPVVKNPVKRRLCTVNALVPDKSINTPQHTGIVLTSHNASVLRCVRGTTTKRTKIDVQNHAIQAAISRSLPTEFGTRNNKILVLARYLKGIDALKDKSADDLLPIVEEWHRQALPNIRTKDLKVTVKDFAHAWPRVKSPLGLSTMDDWFDEAMARSPPPRVVKLFGKDSRPTQLALLCQVLQEHAEDKTFPLSSRVVGRLLKVSHVQGSNILKKLCLKKIIKVVTVGKSGTTSRVASTYRYLG